MKRLSSFVIILSAMTILASCASAPLKQAGMQGESVLAAVRDLSKAYENRNLEAFMDNVDASYPDRDGFKKAVETILLTYQTIHLKIQYTKILVMVQEKGPIKAVFTWEGDWQTLGGKIVKDGARVTLVLDPKTYKLVGIEGKDLFVPTETATPARQ